MQTSNYIILSIGQAGNQMAAAIWRSLCEDHQLRADDGRPARDRSLGNATAFFHRLETDVGETWKPRAVLADTEPAVLLALRREFNGLFHPASFVTSQETAGGNFAAGYRGEAGGLLAEQVMAQVEQEVAACDDCGGVFLLHSLGGGTGSGVGCLVLEEMKQRHPSLPVMSIAVVPSGRVSTGVTEPYNLVLALDVLREKADLCVLFDNDALFAAAQRGWQVAKPELDDLNAIVAQFFSGLTAPMRFNDFLTVEISIRELAMNLVARPGEHFLLPSFAPLVRPTGGKFATHEVNQLVQMAFSDDAALGGTSPGAGSSVSMAVLFRGVREDRLDAESSLLEVRERLAQVRSVPAGLKTGWTGESGCAYAKSITLLTNNAAVSALLERLGRSFDKLWARRAFAAWYVEQGLTEQEMTARREGFETLMRAYREAGRRSDGSGSPFGEVFVESSDASWTFSSAKFSEDSGSMKTWAVPAELPALLEGGSETPTAAELQAGMVMLSSARKYAGQNEKQTPKLVSELNAMAELRLRQGDLSRAESLLREAAHHLAELPGALPEVSLKVTRTLGALHARRGRLDLAIEYLLQAQAHAREAGAYESLTGAALCAHLSWACHHVGDVFHAEQFKAEAKALQEMLEHRAIQPNVLLDEKIESTPMSLEDSILAAARGELLAPVARSLRGQALCALNAEGDWEEWRVECHDPGSSGEDCGLALSSSDSWLSLSGAAGRLSVLLDSPAEEE